MLDLQCLGQSHVKKNDPKSLIWGLQMSFWAIMLVNFLLSNDLSLEFKSILNTFWNKMEKEQQRKEREGGQKEGRKSESSEMRES